MCYDLGGVFIVLTRAEAEERCHSAAVQVSDYRDHVGVGLDGGDAGEVSLDGSGAFAIGSGFVHASAVEIADFLGHGVARAFLGSGLLEDVAKHPEVLLGEFVEASPAGLIIGDGIVLNPIAAGELEEVGARIGGAIKGVEIHAGNGLGADLIGGGGGGKSAGVRLSGGLLDRRGLNRLLSWRCGGVSGRLRKRSCGTLRRALGGVSQTSG